MHSTTTIDIDAPPDVVFRLARPVERWERLLPHYARSRIVDHRPDGSVVVDFVAHRPLLALLSVDLPVAWRARTWDEPEQRRLHFVHVAGVTKGMDVTWWIEPTTTGCRVSIDHDFRPRVLGFAAFVDRWFTRPIAGRTLATFKALAEALAEALADDPRGPSESDPVAATNQRS